MKLSLLKLIDVAILPVILAVVFKLFGLLISSSLFNVGLNITFENIIPIFWVSYPNTNIELAVNSFSHVLMVSILVLGLGWLLIQAHYFHATHISPSKSAKLENLGLSGIVAESFDLIHRSLIWLSLLWFSAFLSLFESLKGTMFLWTSVVLVTISLSLTYVLATDLAKEEQIQENLIK